MEKERKRETIRELERERKREGKLCRRTRVVTWTERSGERETD